MDPRRPTPAGGAPPPPLDPTLPVGPPPVAPTLGAPAPGPPGGGGLLARGLPAQVGRYRIEGVLGRGGMGVVLRGVDPAIGRPAAVKLLLGDAVGAEDLARFQREAQAAGRLAHPGIVTVYEVGAHAGPPYLALELLEGGTFEDRLRAGAVSARDAVTVVRDVARAVSYAHACGVVHRDLKPANILFDAAGRPKLGDFGIARQAGSHLTRTGQLLGTPQYMAPEQGGGSARAHRPGCDIHALGAILYRAVTGRAPYEAATVANFLHQLLEVPPTPPRRLAPDLDPALEAIILRCLHKRPEDRYPSAEALVAALDGWLAAPQGPPPRSGRGAAAVAAVAATLGAAAALAAVAVAAARGPGHGQAAPVASATTPPPTTAPAPAPPPSPPAAVTLREVATLGSPAGACSGRRGSRAPRTTAGTATPAAAPGGGPTPGRPSSWTSRPGASSTPGRRTPSRPPPWPSPPGRRGRSRGATTGSSAAGT